MGFFQTRLCHQQKRCCHGNHRHSKVTILLSKYKICTKTGKGWDNFYRLIKFCGIDTLRPTFSILFLNLGQPIQYLLHTYISYMPVLEFCFCDISKLNFVQCCMKSLPKGHCAYPLIICSHIFPHK